MNNYLKLNQDRWNNVKNDYTKPITHEELEEARKHPISVALTVGKKVPTEWFEKGHFPFDISNEQLLLLKYLKLP